LPQILQEGIFQSFAGWCFPQILQYGCYCTTYTTWAQTTSMVARIVAAYASPLAQLRNNALSGKLIPDRSLISDKPEPEDIDCLFIYDEKSDAVLKSDSAARHLIDYQRWKSSKPGDIFVFPETTVTRSPNLCPLDVFDYDRSGKQTGVVEIAI
jgi:hypothetical protein